MRKLIVIIFMTAGLYGQASAPPSDVEAQVLKTIQELWQQQGSVTFSSLYNSDRFSEEERAFLGRLYEIFFAIPGILKSEYESTGLIPSRADLANTFGVSRYSIELLLSVMEKDGRVPPLFTRDTATREIKSLNMDNLNGFLANKGSEVKMAQWEGKPLPSFDLATLDGGRLKDTDLRGENSLIYIWFTGCPPCVRIAPILAELAEKYDGQGFKFVGINADDILELDTTNQSRLEYVRKQGLRFVNANLDQPARKAFGTINLYPTLFFVKKDGTIYRHLVNFQGKEKLTAIIEEMLSSS